MAKQGTQPLAGRPPRNDDPASDAAAVTPSDVADLANYPRSLYVGVTGDVAVYMADDATGVSVVFKNVPQGTSLRICARRVLAAGTTATNIVALY